MMIFVLLILLLSILKIYANDCIGGYEDPFGTGTCTECPSGKASGSQSWKDVNGASCMEVPYTCGAGQTLTAYSGGYYYCNSASSGTYCPNGKCLIDYRSGYSYGENYCPGQYTTPSSGSIGINPSNPGAGVVSPSNPPLQTSTDYSVTTSSGVTTYVYGAIMCTASDTQFCPAGTGFYNTGVVDSSNNLLNAGTAGCFNCTAGTAQDGTTKVCTTCPTNTYSAPLASSCKSTCPGGYGFVTTLAPTSTATEMKACKLCDAGYYNDGSSIACKQCPSGTASSQGSSECITVDQSCSPGEYLTIFADKSVCSAVPSNYYCFNGRCLYLCNTISSTTINTYGTYGTSCTGTTGNICDASYRSTGPRSTLTGSTACTSSDSTYTPVRTDCPAGSYKPSESYNYGCYPCKAGQFRGAGDDLNTCSFCGIGSVSGIGSGACSNVCPAGKGIATSIATSCTTCPAGYVNPLDASIVDSVDNTGVSKKCFLCNTQSFGNKFATACEQCPYPKETVVDYSKNLFYLPIEKCQIINFRTYAQAVTAVEVFMVVLFFGSMYFVRNVEDGKVKANLLVAFGLILYIALPALDTLTSIAYVMTSNFYNYTIFGLVLAIIIADNFIFFKRLWELGARVRLFIPVPSILILPKYDSLYKVLFTSILSLPWIILNSWFLVPWILLGFFLQSSKVFAIGGVANMWLRVWTGNDNLSTTQLIDVSVLNEYIYLQILIESIPQLALQLANNILLKQQWSGVQIFSIVLSGLNTLNVLYKFIYYKFYKKLSLAEIPLEVKILNFEIIKIDPPEITRLSIHEMTHLHHHKTSEVLEKLLEVVENSQIVHDNIKLLQEDVLDIQSHLRLSKTTKHFIDVVDDRIHTVMVDLNTDVTLLDDTISKIEEEVEALREDLVHVKMNGDWSARYKEKHGTRLSIHHEYSVAKQDLEEGADDKIPGYASNKHVESEKGYKEDSVKTMITVTDQDSNSVKDRM